MTEELAVAGGKEIVERCVEERKVESIRK